LLTDNIAEEALEVFSGYPDIEADRVGTPAADELARMLPDYDAIIVRSPTRLTADLIAAGTRLKFIGRAGVGVDNIDVEEATSRDITVMNSPGGNTVSTAEHTIAMLLALARRIPAADRSLREGRWERGAFKGIELYKKTLGIIGLGRVGREVARRMLAFSMRVVAVDPYVTPEAARELGVERVEMDGLLRESHFITVHVPLGAETRAIIAGEEIARMRDGVFLVNCARGGVIDEKAVGAALESGKVAGVAFDVFEHEPPGGNALLSHGASAFTPHLGAATRDAQIRVAVDVARNVADALVTGEVRDAVNRSKP
ncbi:MAG: hydroxyacid dehydrogenase, partial [Candidatus Krumholzibacteriia bacterium]